MSAQNKVLTRRAGAGFSLDVGTLHEAQEMCRIIAGSNMIPDRYKGKPRDVFVAIAMGRELGLSPLQSLQGIAVINGTPAVFGDSLIGIVRASEACEWIQETLSEDQTIATCTAKRRGQPEQSRRFSLADADRAGLLNRKTRDGKPVTNGPWQQYPQRMIQMRARAWCLRDLFADVLKGLGSAEELETVEIVRTVQSEPVTDLASRLSRVADALGDDHVEIVVAAEGSHVEQDDEEATETDAGNSWGNETDPLADGSMEGRGQDPAGEDSEPAMVDTPHLPHQAILDAILDAETQEELIASQALIQLTDEPDRARELKRACVQRAREIG